MTSGRSVAATRSSPRRDESPIEDLIAVLAAGLTMSPRASTSEDTSPRSPPEGAGIATSANIPVVS